MEHVAYFMNENTYAYVTEQKRMQKYFDDFDDKNLLDVYRRNVYHEMFKYEDIEYVKDQYKEFQIVLCVCKSARMLIDIQKKR